MKRILSFSLALMMALLLLAGCGNKDSGSKATEPGSGSAGTTGGKPTVTLWTTGSQNLSDMFTAAIKVYNERPESKAKVELQFLMSGTGDTLLWDRLAAAYQTDHTAAGFDIIAENGTNLPRYVAMAGSEDLFSPIDFELVPNHQNVVIKSSFDNSKVVPYRGTTVVFAYDSERLPEPPKTWDELQQWIHENPGRFAYNVPSTGGAGAGFVGTAIYRNMPEESRISDDPKWMEDWPSGFDWLKEIHPDLYQSGGSVVYPNKNQGTLDLLINKEVDLIPAWADQILANKAEGILPESVKLYQLDQPLNGTDVVFALPSIGSYPEECCDFINFMLTPEMQKLCLETIAAIPVIDPEMVDSPAMKEIAGLNVNEFAIISLGELLQELEETWDIDIGTLG